MNTYKVIKIEGTLIYLGKDDGTLLKVEEKGEKDSATLILGATIFATILAIIVRVLLTL